MVLALCNAGRLLGRAVRYGGTMISDEYGVPVMVAPKSPANVYVNLLKRRHFAWIVLPRRVYLGLTTPAECGIMDVHMEQNPPRAYPQGAADVTSSDKWALLHVRMQECISVCI